MSPPGRETARLVLATSGVRGWYLIQQLLRLEKLLNFRIVLVTCDRPDRFPRLTHREKRGTLMHWDPEIDLDHLLVPMLAGAIPVADFQGRAIPYYEGNLKTDAFYTLCEGANPTLGISNVNGQILNRKILEMPAQGWFNLHTTKGREWPNPIYRGANPIGTLLSDGSDHFNVALHRMVEEVDAGELYALSPDYPIPCGASSADMVMLTAVSATLLVRQQLPRILDGEPSPLMLQGGEDA